MRNLQLHTHTGVYGDVSTKLICHAKGKEVPLHRISALPLGEWGHRYCFMSEEDRDFILTNYPEAFIPPNQQQKEQIEKEYQGGIPPNVSDGAKFPFNFYELSKDYKFEETFSHTENPWHTRRGRVPNKFYTNYSESWGWPAD